MFDENVKQKFAETLAKVKEAQEALELCKDPSEYDRLQDRVKQLQIEASYLFAHMDEDN